MVGCLLKRQYEILPENLNTAFKPNFRPVIKTANPKWDSNRKNTNCWQVECHPLEKALRCSVGYCGWLGTLHCITERNHGTVTIKTVEYVFYYYYLNRTLPPPLLILFFAPCTALIWTRPCTANSPPADSTQTPHHRKQRARRTKQQWSAASYLSSTQFRDHNSDIPVTYISRKETRSEHKATIRNKQNARN